MFAPQGYRIVEQLHDGERSLVFRASSDANNTPVIIKVLHRDAPSSLDIGQFKREFAISRRFKHAGIVYPLELKHHQSHWMILQEDIGGISLDKVLAQQPTASEAPALPLATFFEVALQLCSALDCVHGNSIIHKDINPSNLVWSEALRRLQITDFGISGELGQEMPGYDSPHRLEGTLRYMAPEQTGRMNRIVDYRADYYAVGATLYELLTGSPPFVASDAMELVHSHIARTPDFSLPVFSRLPAALVLVLQRLLEKNAEQRYQTIHGLKRDLARCQELTLTPGRLASLPSSLSDHSGIFQIPQKLYGREHEIEQLLGAVERVAGGSSEMLLVAGYSGIGKSAVVNEVHKPIVARRGAFVSGKFDQFRRDEPYASLVQAFRELARQLLSEPARKLQQWADKLRQALGANIGVMVELIPELQLIVGATPPVVVLPPGESQNRLNRLFQRFVQVFSSPGRPLVIFLDDLQWADAPTLKLIELFMRDPDAGHTLFIGAYRDNEVDAAHPLMALCDTLRTAGAPLSTLTLTPLAEPHVARLIADTLRVPIASCAPLTALCYRKTQGNAFFLNQFLRTIHDAGHLHYEFGADCWQWDIAALEQAGFTDNVVELMLGKIHRLPGDTQRMLQLAASIGNRFDMHTLAVVSEQSLYDTQQCLWPALRAGLIRPLDQHYKYVEAETTSSQTSYRFLHDRVQQAAYAVAAERQRRETHLIIGRLLLRHATAQTLDEQLFTIVEQLNAGRDLIDAPAERLQLARLNLQAGLKARSAAAYQAALRHTRIGQEMLPGKAWQDAFELCLDLYLSAAETAYLCGEFDAAEGIYPQVLPHCKTALQKVRCYSVQAAQYQLQGRFLEAIAIQREGLQLLGIDIPDDEALLQASVAPAFAAVDALCQGRSMQDIMAAGEMTDAGQLAAMQLLLGMWYASYLAGRPTLNAITTLSMTQLTLQEGNCDISSFTYVNYAFIVAFILQKYERGDAFGCMAVELSNQRANLAIRASTYFLFATFTNHWNRPLLSSDSYYDAAFGWALESGDFATVGYIVAVRSTERVIQGQYLPDLLQAQERDILLLHSTGQIDMVDCTMVGSVQSIKNLLGRTSSPDSYDDEHFSEVRFLADYAGAPLHLAYFYHGKIRNAFLFDTAQAESLATQFDLIEQALPGQCKIPEAAFYAALIWIRALRRDTARPDAAVLQARLAQLQAKLAIWAAQCPANFAAKHLLTLAEVARTACDVTAALSCYQQAIELARTHGYPNLEAVANELCSGFWQEQGQTRLAEVFMQDALQAYLHWGADGKVLQLRAAHAYLRLPPTVRQPKRQRLRSQSGVGSSGTTATSTTTANAALDLASIVKASLALSSEIGLRQVLARLMEIVRENSGAQVARLLLHDEVWRLEADSADNSTAVLQARPVLLDVMDHPLLPLSLLRYVVRTGGEVIEECIASSTRFAADPYVLAQQPKSVMCLPIHQAGQLRALLYLENNLLQGCFTAERAEFLRIISTQALIAIDHARLHDSLEAQVAARTAELNRALLEQRAIFDNALTGIAFLKHRVIQRCNVGFEKMFGYAAGELEQKSTRILYITEEDFQRRGQMLQQSLSRGGKFTDDVNLRRKDGKQLWCSAHAKFIDEYDPEQGVVLVMQDISARKLAERALEHANSKLADLSTTDGLTGIPNRRKFDEVGFVEWQRAMRQQEMLAIAIVDVDHFKIYNDHFGHQAGDICLRTVAQSLLNGLRRSGDFVARYGGEEFIIVLPGQDAPRASETLNKLRQSVEAMRLPHPGNAVMPFVTFSAGYACAIPQADLSLAHILEMADKNLYKAKRNGRNQVCGS